MSDADRRNFLKKLALTTAYVAPIVRTLAAPDPAAGQALSKKGGKRMGMTKGFSMDESPFPVAPWSTNDD